MSGVPSIPIWTDPELFTASSVGHAIISARSLAQDPCSLVQPPGANAFTLASSSNGTLAAGTWYVAVTWQNPWGETTAFEQSIILTTVGGIVVTIPAIPVNCNANVYWGPYSQAETNLQRNTGTPFSITSPQSGYSVLPLQNTAFLPDTDGTQFSAASFYRWMNEGLDEMCRITGGILDRAGFPTTVGMGQVELPIYWTKITNIWYDGWPAVMDYRKNMFYYNAIPGIPSIVTMNQIAGRLIMEMWPQALRTANQTTLSQAIGTNDTIINVVNSNPTSDTNVVNIGCVMIHDPTQNRFPEWCYFNNQTPNSYTNVTRGIGGSKRQSWNNGTVLYEANFQIAGYRMARHYYPGDANDMLDCPPGWQNALTDFLMYRFKQGLQDTGEATGFQQSFQQKAQGLAQQKEIMRRNRLPRFNAGPP